MEKSSDISEESNKANTSHPAESKARAAKVADAPGEDTPITS